MKKIAFIIPWFGPFPFWMSYTLASIAKNSTIDFLFFTDNDTPENAPPNCIFHKTSFEDYKLRVSEKLNINFTPENPYKLCDIKPSYGLIHDEDIKEYDFWGFCDIDVIFGCIRHFLTDELLDNYEFFSSQGTRVSGHFTLMKNDEHWQTIFQKRPDWKYAFEDNSKHHNFDEKSFSELFIGFKNWPSFLQKKLIHIFKPHSRKAYIKEMYSTPNLRYNWIDGSRNFPSEWYWQNGNLTNNASNEQFLYLHFLKWKRDWDKNKAITDIAPKNLNKSWKVSQKGFQNI